MLLRMTADEVTAGPVFVHQLQKSLLDARALLVDGIVQWIHQFVHTFNDFIPVHPPSRLHIVVCQLIFVVSQFLELNAFGMCQK